MKIAGTRLRVNPFAVLFILAATSPALASHPESKTLVSYVIHVDPADLTGFGVEIRFRNSTNTSRIAMASHPLQDDRYYRYVENLTAESHGTKLSVTREADALWRIDGARGDVTVKYRIHLPPVTTLLRAAWRPFLSPAGGMVGDLHSFMYVLGAESAPAQVSLDTPKDWDIASGLESTHDPRTLSATSSELLLDSPILIGHFRRWNFLVGGIPHHIVYFPQPNTVPFDAEAFIGGVQKLVNEAVRIFGKLPYRSYTFFYLDGTNGVLEHLNSITISANSADLARGFSDVFGTTAHEFFHTWNLLHVRPVERVGLSYRQAQPTPVLWWSEGVTIFFADLLLRRAKLPVSDPTRVAHLERNIAEYLSAPGYARISPERASLAVQEPLAFGNDYVSFYLQGQLLGTMLDIIILDATHGQRSLDDVMRLLSDRFSPSRGIREANIETAVHDVCRCNVHSFFDAHVRGTKRIDFNRYLRMIGLQSRVAWQPARNNDGTLASDLRLFPYNTATDPTIRLRLLDPSSAWAKVGLTTGDQLLSYDGHPLQDVAEFRSWLRQLRVGQAARLEVMRNEAKLNFVVPITGYDRPILHIDAIENATPEQRKLRELWDVFIR